MLQVFQDAKIMSNICFPESLQKNKKDPTMQALHVARSTAHTVHGDGTCEWGMKHNNQDEMSCGGRDPPMQNETCKCGIGRARAGETTI